MGELYEATKKRDYTAIKRLLLVCDSQSDLRQAFVHTGLMEDETGFELIARHWIAQTLQNYEMADSEENLEPFCCAFKEMANQFLSEIVLHEKVNSLRIFMPLYYEAMVHSCKGLDQYKSWAKLSNLSCPLKTIWQYHARVSPSKKVFQVIYESKVPIRFFLKPDDVLAGGDINHCLMHAAAKGDFAKYKEIIKKAKESRGFASPLKVEKQAEQFFYDSLIALGSTEKVIKHIVEDNLTTCELGEALFAAAQCHEQVVFTRALAKLKSKLSSWGSSDLEYDSILSKVLTPVIEHGNVDALRILLVNGLSADLVANRLATIFHRYFDYINCSVTLEFKLKNVFSTVKYVQKFLTTKNLLSLTRALLSLPTHEKSNLAGAYLSYTLSTLFLKLVTVLRQAWGSALISPTDELESQVYLTAKYWSVHRQYLSDVRRKRERGETEAVVQYPVEVPPAVQSVVDSGYQLMRAHIDSSREAVAESRWQDRGLLVVNRALKRQKA